MPISDEDLKALRQAARALERLSLAARLTNMIGNPIELIGSVLPPRASQIISRATTAALQGALSLALLTMREGPQKASNRMHILLATASGAAGGAFGLAALPLELPVSTAIMLRSVADIARSEGEDLSSPETVLSCLQVFALGARPETDGAFRSGYFTIRSIFANSLTEAASFIAERSIAGEGAPVLVRLLSQIGSRFGIVVSEKVAAQAIPVVGALGGAAINYAFIGHFQDVARGHFTVRRLERIYGKEMIRREYQRFRDLDKSDIDVAAEMDSTGGC